ncbi:MAG: hypothetical protein ACKOYM_10940 [Actinomycetes bacterium]
MQIAYLSNRPTLLAETLGHVGHFMPWVSEAVVLAPAARHQLLLDSLPPSAPPVTLIDEAELLTADETAQLGTAHAAHNAVLRRALIERGPLDATFLQSDDDYRPLKPIDPTFFVDADGRMVPYAFYDLALWRKDETSFDRAQHATYLALQYLGAGQLAYAAHMPQVIRRDLALGAYEAATALTDSTEFCEWTLPIGYGQHTDPDAFTAPRPFVTMCWPRLPHEWPFWVRPRELAFENHYPDLYEPGQLFDGIPTALDPDHAERHSFEKMSRWYRFDLDAGRLNFPEDITNPWLGEAGTASGRARRLFFRALRPARRAYEYLALEERTQLVELASAIDRLERGRLDGAPDDSPRP